MQIEKFPIIKAGHVFNEFNGKLIKKPDLMYKSITIDYPARLDAMAINPAAVAYNEEMIFTPGEVVVSIERFIRVKIKVISSDGGNLVISNSTKRKALVKHAYKLMCRALNVNPSLEIDVNDDQILKHCGFGSSSSTIAAISAAINELYNLPMLNNDLIKYLASNHGEELCDENEDELKVVQCIGGGATGGLTDAGIIIIAGRACTISKIKYIGKVIIGVPNDFVQQNADVLMELEEKNLYKFKKTGELYKDKIAYSLLHLVLPDMTNNSIDELAKVVFDYRFNMGSIDNCSFTFDRVNKIAQNIRRLYEEKKCKFLALSSVGPAFFAIVDEENENECIKEFEKQNMKTICVSICNTKYLVINKEKADDNDIRNEFWSDKVIIEEFLNKLPSEYITKCIDKYIDLNDKVIDIGCGGGRYSKYLYNKNIEVLALDRHEKMAESVIKNGIKFIKSDMSNIPLNDSTFDFVLSIGVMHNATSISEFIKSIQEVKRLLKKSGKLICSIFTNDLISDDLNLVQNHVYSVNNKPPMVLFSSEEIDILMNLLGLYKIEEIDRHVTDVGTGKRYVYSAVYEK